MITQKITGADLILGKPEDWKEEACGSLWVRREHDALIGPSMVSSWKPTPEELELLNKGHAVHLRVCGQGHPPVSLVVALTPDP